MYDIVIALILFVNKQVRDFNTLGFIKKMVTFETELQDKDDEMEGLKDMNYQLNMKRMVTFN